MNNWYQTLTKPFLTPPAIVFKIAWGILYTLIFISIILYLKGGVSKKDIFALILMGLGLSLNFCWGYVFFVLHKMNIALVMIGLMFILLVPVIILFYKKAKISGLILIPYALWLLFAFYLNLSFILNNPSI